MTHRCAAYALAGIVSGCGGTTLVGSPLTGLVGFRVESGDGVASADFVLLDRPETFPSCPSVAEDAITFNGAVVTDATLGGADVSWVSQACLPVTAHVSRALDGGDGALAVHSGGEVVRYVGTDLLAARSIVALDGTAAERGGSLRFRLEPHGEDASVRSASIALDGLEERGALPVADGDGDFTVQFPADAPTGSYAIEIALDVVIAQGSCDGFSSCDVSGELIESVEVRVR